MLFAVVPFFLLIRKRFRHIETEVVQTGVERKRLDASTAKEPGKGGMDYYRLSNHFNETEEYRKIIANLKERSAV